MSVYVYGTCNAQLCITLTAAFILSSIAALFNSKDYCFLSWSSPAFMLCRSISSGRSSPVRSGRDGKKSSRTGQLRVWCGLQCCPHAQVSFCYCTLKHQHCGFGNAINSTNSPSCYLIPRNLNYPAQPCYNQAYVFFHSSLCVHYVELTSFQDSLNITKTHFLFPSKNYWPWSTKRKLHSWN